MRYKIGDTVHFNKRGERGTCEVIDVFKTIKTYIVNSAQFEYELFLNESELISSGEYKGEHTC